MGEGSCKDITIADCDLESGLIITNLYTLDAIMCQDICQDFADCIMFRFDRTSIETNCQLFESTYRGTCNIVAAPIVSYYEVCYHKGYLIPFFLSYIPH